MTDGLASKVDQQSIEASNATGEAAIETESLTKSYGRLVAVDALNIAVPRGAIYALIGPNGAGKTTTFSLLATLLRPDSGTSWIMGFSPVDEPVEVRRVLGFMPDFFGVYDDVTVREYLEFFAAAYRIPPRTRKQVISDLLELVDLAHKADSFVESLSRGMKQRLGLARALVHDPQVLILDEPASGLDPRARVELRELIRELGRMGKSILISSHILSELEEVCTYVGIIEAGKLLVQGPPSEILAGLREARVFRLKLASEEGARKAVEVIQAFADATGLESVGESLEFSIQGGDAAAAELLATLAQAKVPIVEFAETKAGLEELFLKITKGIVQ